MEMEEEINPYEYDQDQNDSEDGNFESYGTGERGYEGGYTLRRLAVMTIDKLLDSYTDDVWNICEPTLKASIASNSTNPKENSVREVGILLIGIIYSKIEEHLDFLEQALPLLVCFITSETLPNIVRCTSLWTI